MRHHAILTLLLKCAAVAAPILAPALAMDLSRRESRTDLAVQRYGVSGAGVVIAIFDRGIDWRHPDFIKPDGTTRIKFILDMTGQQYCDVNNPPAIEYAEDQINAALAGQGDIDHRDAVGHGTVSAGIAAGNGRAYADGKYAGMAPKADLIIVKITGGAGAHDDQPAEPYFTACSEEALNWLNEKLAELGEPPCVGILNLGVQWGPMDGSSVVTRQVDEVFGADRPGRIYATGTGDEGGYPTHAGIDFDHTEPAIVRFTKSAGYSGFTGWYTGETPAWITFRLDDGTVVGPVGAGDWAEGDGILTAQISPGQEFYPWTSDSGDRAFWVAIDGHEGGGQVEIQAMDPGAGYIDYYIVGDGSVIRFDDHLVPGRLSDLATVHGAVVTSVYVSRDRYVDINGVEWDVSWDGYAGGLWNHSSDGPTRDGRLGVDIATPGHNVFAAYCRTSEWGSCCPWNLVEDGGRWYGGGGAASASGPLLNGAIALMMELKPDLTANEAREVLRSTARADDITGDVPNGHWGYGKLDMLAALDRLAGRVAGDMNCDGSVDFDDIDPFVTALISRPDYEAAYPACFHHHGDINNDGSVDFDDIDGFVECLINGGCD